MCASCVPIDCLHVRACRAGAPLGYWVAGRIYPPSNECFVCYHESMPEHLVEVAFELAYAMAS